MWKYILAFCIVAAAIVLVTRQQHSAAEEAQRQGQSQSVPFTVPPTDQGQTAQDRQQPTYSPPWWYELLTWPDSIETWALLLTLFAVGYQASLLHQHASHFKDLAAKTALAATAASNGVSEARKAYTLAEKNAKRQLRAYICLESAEVTLPNGQPLALVNFKNFGETPAYEVHGWIAVEAGPHPLQGSLPIPTDKIVKPKTTVGPKSGFGYPGRRKTPLFTGAEIATISGKSAALYVYGRVEYRDAFGDYWYTNVRLIAGGIAGLRTSTSKDGSVRWVIGPDLEGNDAT